MRTLKKTLALVLVLAMMFSLCVTASADFTDEDEIKYVEAVEVMAALGVLEGNPDGSFNPKGTLTRAEAATIIVRLLGAEDLATAAEATFDDVAADHWAADAIAYCAEEGIVAGYGDGKFGPKDTLTAYQWAKMLLVAIGYEADDYTGSAWQIAVAKDANDAGIFAGNLKADKTVGATREEAALYALNAAKEGIDTVYYEVTYGTPAKTYKFDTWEDASIVVALKDATWEKKVATSDSILEDVFGVDYDRTTDASGRPMTKYTGKILGEYGLSFVDAPIATFNTAMTEKALFAAIGATGIQGASDKYIVMDRIYQDGYVEGEAVASSVAGQFDGKGTGTCNDSVIICKNEATNNVDGMGNGNLVEIYATANANRYVMVSTTQHIDTVTSIVKADADKGVKRQAVIAAGSFATEEFERGDVVIYTMAQGNIVSMELAETITGKVTKIANNAVYTIGDAEYVMSQYATCAAPTLGAVGTWYVDGCGNLIALNELATADVYYGILVGYESVQKSPSLLYPVDPAEKITLFTAEGKKVVYDGAFDVNALTGVATFVMNSDTTIANMSSDFGKLYAYTLTADGKIATISAAALQNNGDSITITKGNALTTGVVGYMNDDTVVFYADGSTPVNYAVYTGYKAVPTKTGTVNTWIYDDNGGFAVMYVTVSDVDAVSEAQYVYVKTAAATSETTATGTVLTMTDVYVDGALVEGGMVVDAVKSAGLYTYTVNAKGVATLSSASALDTETAITGIESGYFKASGAYYFDAETEFYQIDELGNIVAVDSLPALSINGAYTVNMLFADKAGSATNAADIVVFNVK